MRSASPVTIARPPDRYRSLLGAKGRRASTRYSAVVLSLADPTRVGYFHRDRPRVSYLRFLGMVAAILVSMMPHSFIAAATEFVTGKVNRWLFKTPGNGWCTAQTLRGDGVMRSELALLEDSGDRTYEQRGERVEPVEDCRIGVSGASRWKT